jgi:hypothetical protein
VIPENEVNYSQERLQGLSAKPRRANAISLHDWAAITGTFTLKAGAASTFHGSTQTNHPTLDLTRFKGTQDGGPNP